MVEFAKILEVKIPKRVILGVMAFFACFVSYMARVNISVTIVPMSIPLESKHKIDPECQPKKPPTTTTEAPTNISTTKEPPPDYGPRYDWNQQKQGHILASFTYGYILTQLPGGVISEMFGARMVVFGCCVLMGVTTILTPLAAHIHYVVLCVLRSVMGLGAGAIFPALHAIIARWVPPEEKSKFIWCLLGGNIGTVVTWPVIGVMVPASGWPSTFYLCGAVLLIFAAFWVYLIRNSPSSHKSISPEELEYITSRLGTTVTQSPEGASEAKKKKVMPVKKIVTSVPFLSLVLLHYGNLWGLFFIITETPKFMMEVLGYDLKASGFLSALPSLARVGMGFCFSVPADYFLKKDIFSINCVRKTFVVFSHLIPGLLVMVMGFIGCNAELSVAVLTLSLGFNGAATVTNLANHHDLAPNYAGSLYGIMNSIGTTTGFIIPVFVGEILKEKSGLAQWRIIWLIGGSMYVASALIFFVFGSTKLQSWNTPEEEQAPP